MAAIKVDPAANPAYLSYGVVIGPLDQDCTAVWVLHALNKRVFLFPQNMLIHSTSITLQITHGTT